VKSANGGAAPYREALTESLRRALGLPGRERTLTGAHGPLEALDVELVGADAQQVSVGARDQHVAAGARAVLELLAKLGDVDLQPLGCGRRWALAPQLVDEPIGRDHLVAVQEQQRQERTPLAAADRDGPPAVEDLQWPE